MNRVVGSDKVTAHWARRGPRWAVTGTIRPREFMVTYATTAEAAERIREDWARRGYRTVKVKPPEGSANLAELREERRQAQATLDDVMERMRAAALAALQQGRAEAEVARELGIDRMTVRKWAGK